MNSSPTVSVLMPVRLKDDQFAHVQWLDQAIASVFQSLSGHNFELLLIDDCSIPPLRNSLPRWLDEGQIRLVENATNLGLIRSLNAGLAASRGEFIARIDADDFWQPGRIEIQLGALRSDPDLALSFGSMNLVNHHGAFMELHTRSFGWAEAIQFSQHVGCPIPHGSILIRASVLKAIGGYPYEPASLHTEDFALWSRLLRFFKAKGEEQVFLNYRIHDGSVSKEFQSVQSANTQAVMNSFRRYGPADDFVAAVQRLRASLNMPLLELGLTLHELWRYGGEIRLQPALIADLRRILFDRVTSIAETDDGLSRAVVSEF